MRLLKAKHKGLGATLKYFKVHLDLEADQMEPLFLALEDKESFCPLLRRMVIHKNPRLGKVGELSSRLRDIMEERRKGVGRFVYLNASREIIRFAVFKGE